MQLWIFVLALCVTFIRASDLTAYQIESYRTAFDAFDEEKVGSVSKESVAEIFEILEIPYTNESVTESVNELDENNSGRLEFDEFIKLVSKFI